MPRAVVLLCLLCAHLAGAAPARVVRGVVTDAATGRALVGATAFTALGDIATTDADGYFRLELVSGDAAVSVAADGYAAKTVALGAADELLHVALVASASAEVIEVKGKAPEQTNALAYQLTAEEIRMVPGAANDVLRATQVLPGVARIPYAFGGLVLRGASPSDTAVYLDGIEVPIAFHFGGITSFYPSEMLDDLTLTSGGFGVEHGRAQGGLVTLTTREPRTDRWRVGGSIGLLDSGVMAEGPALGGGVIVGVRRSYFDFVASPFVSADIPLPSYWDAQLRGSFGDPTRLGRITPMLFTSIDQIATNNPSANGGKGISITSLFVRAAVPYLKTWGPLTLHVVPWLGTDQLTFSDNDNATHTQESFERPVYPGGLRADLTRDYVWGHLRGGLDAQGGYLSHSSIGFTGSGDGPAQQNGAGTVTWAEAALWAESRIKLDGERFAVKPGVRLDYDGLNGEVSFDPRLNIHQQLTNRLVLRQAIGRFHQTPTPADVDPTNGNPRLQASYYDQMSLGVDADVGDGITASLTGFYNYGQNLGVREPTNRPGDDFMPNLGGLGPTFQLLLERQLGFSFYRENVGRGRSYGSELLVKVTHGRFFFLFAYTLSRAERVDDARLTQSGAFPYLWRPFELDQRHNFNAATSVAVGKWRLGARVQIVSGNPYSPTVSGDGTQDPFARHLPPFFSLDLRADRRWRRCWGDITLYFDVQNATNYHNIEGREYSSGAMMDQDVSGLPLIPFFGVEFLPK